MFSGCGSCIRRRSSFASCTSLRVGSGGADQCAGVPSQFVRELHFVEGSAADRSLARRFGLSQFVRELHFVEGTRPATPGRTSPTSQFVRELHFVEGHDLDDDLRRQAGRRSSFASCTSLRARRRRGPLVDRSACRSSFASCTSLRVHRNVAPRRHRRPRRSSFASCTSLRGPERASRFRRGACVAVRSRAALR